MATYYSGTDVLKLSQLDGRVLLSLAAGANTGYGLARQCEIDAQEVRGCLNPGTVHPALKRLREYGFIGKEGKMYRLTKVGEEQLKAEADRWQSWAGLAGERLPNDTKSTQAVENFYTGDFDPLF
jgi:DNA-binding PadR family transcriptional regulator